MTWQPLVTELTPKLVALRRQIHSQPELAFQENKTAALVAGELAACELKTATGIAGTGVTGLLEGRSQRTLAIRADMDALPLQEETGAPYASTVAGIAHACGHDGHIAIALGAAMVLSRLAPLAGAVKFIFQPAEEGPGGARPMIEHGVLREPPVEAALGFHLTNSLPQGHVGISYGQTCAATDEIRILIGGRGGHGAHPQQTVDAIVVAAQVVTALQTIVSRQVSPLEAVVVTIGAIRGGAANNIIADKVELWGTVRTLAENLRTALPEKIERLVAGTTTAYGAGYRFVYHQGYPVLVSDVNLSSLVETSAAAVVGRENVTRLQPSMGGEDFAYFAAAVPSTFFRIGSGGPNFHFPAHHPQFDFDEEAIGVGVRVLVQSVLDYFATP